MSATFLAFMLAAGAPEGIASAYTHLDLDRCRQFDLGEVSTTWRCKGYAGVPLIVQNDDERYDLDARPRRS